MWYEIEKPTVLVFGESSIFIRWNEREDRKLLSSSSFLNKMVKSRINSTKLLLSRNYKVVVLDKHF